MGGGAVGRRRRLGGNMLRDVLGGRKGVGIGFGGGLMGR